MVTTDYNRSQAFYLSLKKFPDFFFVIFLDFPENHNIDQNLSFKNSIRGRKYKIYTCPIPRDHLFLDLFFYFYRRYAWWRTQGLNTNLLFNFFSEMKVFIFSTLQFSDSKSPLLNVKIKFSSVLWQSSTNFCFRSTKHVLAVFQGHFLSLLDFN